MLKLNDEMIENAGKIIGMGHYITTCCQHLGIQRGTFYNWLKWGKERPKSKYAKFLKRIEKAESEFVLRTFGKIQQVGFEQNNWQALAWTLERRFPEMFGKREIALHTETTEDNSVNIVFNSFPEPEKETGPDGD